MDVQPTESDPRIGLLLQERYRILRKLGSGGMGAVYEAVHELIKKPVAIKCLHVQFATDANVVARFHREAQAATMIGNEHIIEVTDMGRFPDGAPYIVLELLDGRELAQVIKQSGPLAISRVVHVFSQACEALAAAHEKGIVHRDLKPENIFLVTRRRDPDFVKVLDFGISKMKQHGEELGGGLTKTGMAMGTPYYMSPEQVQGRKDIDHRTDVYALGVILYQVLTGRLPFEAETYPALMVKIMTEQAQPPRLLRSDIPEALERVVLRALEKNAAARFQSVTELSDALAPFAKLSAPPVLAELPLTRIGEPASTAAAAVAVAEPVSTAAAAVGPAPTSVGDKARGRGPLYALGAIALALVATIVVLVANGALSGQTASPAPPAVTPTPVPSPILREARAPAATPAPAPAAAPAPVLAPAPTATLPPTAPTTPTVVQTAANRDGRRRRDRRTEGAAPTTAVASTATTGAVTTPVAQTTTPPPPPPVHADSAPGGAPDYHPPTVGSPGFRPE